MRRLLLMAPAALLLGAAAPDGKSIALHGNGHGALPCQACHGMKFEGNASIGAPALAGQPAAAALAALARIAAGTMGQNYVMKNIALALTPAERRAVADYLAGLQEPK